MSIKKSDISSAINAENKTTFTIGEAVFIRTVTYHMIGRISRVSQHEGIPFLHLADASWVSDSGRFGDTIAEGKLSEVEPVNVEIRVSVATIVDVYPWDHPFPRRK